MRFRRRLAAFLLLLASVATAQALFASNSAAQEPPPLPQIEGGVFSDPAGHFTVPVPTNWRVELNEGWATLFAPEDAIRVDIVAFKRDTLEGAFEAAWALVDSEFDRAVDETVVVPAAPLDLDELIVLSYARDDDEPIVQAEGRRLGNNVYVLIFQGSLVAFQQRAAQVQIIDSGFRIVEAEEADLAGVQPLPFDEALIAEFEAYLVEKMNQLEVPGAAVALVRDGELVYANGFGVRDLDTGEPVTPETRMMIGSSTKSMTTLLMAMLVDDGDFAWDTPVTDILPTFRLADPAVTAEITMRNLVCACTGVPRRDFEWLLNASELDAEDIIESLATFELFTEFGETFQYSNQMVATAGYLAALAAGGEYGQLYDDFVALFDRRLLTPIGMTRSTFSFTDVVASGNYASPYGRLPGGGLTELPLATEAILTPLGPAGALWSTVLDVANYLITDLAMGVTPSGERLVSAENLEVTWEPQVAISADASYGLGWIIEDYDGIRIISHGGNTFGFTSELALLPEHGIGISILTNQQGSLLNAVARQRLLELIFDQEPRVDELLAFQQGLVDEAQAELAAKIAGATINAAAISPYLGTYRHPALGDVTLSWQDDQLIFDAGEIASPIVALKDDDTGDVEYITTMPPLAGVPLAFDRDADGNPVIVFGVGVVEYTLQQVR